MPVIHHTSICTTDVDASLRFWRDGLGFEVFMDHSFDGPWSELLRAPSDRLRAVFLGDPSNPDAGILELVDIGPVAEGAGPGERPTTGFLLVSVMADVDATLARLAELGLGGEPRRVDAMGVIMAVVVDPDGVQVELVDTAAVGNLEQLTDGT